MRVVGIYLLLVVFGTFTSANLAYADGYHGKVVSIADGDTITILLADNSTLKIRLAEIDAPEKSQPFGAKSKQMLSEYIFQKDVNVKSDGLDRYGRVIGRVYQNDLDVNYLMVENGGAWAYIRYLKDESILKAERNAKEKKIGLWALQADQITPPWEWRRQK